LIATIANQPAPGTSAAGTQPATAIQQRARAGRRGRRAVDRWRFTVKRLVLVFSKEKETKGTYRYQELDVPDRDTAVGSLYLKKAVVGDPPPAQLRVTIEENPGPAV
jgi:hypothetical protein